MTTNTPTSPLAPIDHRARAEAYRARIDLAHVHTRVRAVCPDTIEVKDGGIAVAVDADGNVTHAAPVLIAIHKTRPAPATLAKVRAILREYHPDNPNDPTKLQEVAR